MTIWRIFFQIKAWRVGVREATQKCVIKCKDKIFTSLKYIWEDVENFLINRDNSEFSELCVIYLRGLEAPCFSSILSLNIR